MMGLSCLVQLGKTSFPALYVVFNVCPAIEPVAPTGMKLYRWREDASIEVADFENLSFL